MTTSIPEVNTETTRGVSILGLVALVLGVLACLVCWKPFIGLLALPVGLIGLFLASLGIIGARRTKKTGLFFPLSGGVACLIAVVVAVVTTGMAVKAIMDAVLAPMPQAKSLDELPPPALATAAVAAPAVPAAAVVPPPARRAELRLKDDTLVVGAVVALKDGAYTVNTGSLGMLTVAADQVTAIRYLDDTAATAVALPVVPAARPPVVPVASAQAGTVTAPENKLVMPAAAAGAPPQVQELMTQILSDPSSMSELDKLLNDPEVLEVLNDPDTMKDVNSGSYMKLMTNPRFLKLMAHPALRKIAGEAAHPSTVTPAASPAKAPAPASSAPVPAIKPTALVAPGAADHEGDDDND